MPPRDSYVLDAHVLIWYLEANPRLGANAQAVMDDPASRLYLPIIALAEACWVVERGRTAIPTVAALLADVDADSRITVVPLNRAIFDMANTLKAIGEMHDRQIAATTLHLAAASGPASLLTRDENIRESRRGAHHLVVAFSPHCEYAANASAYFTPLPVLNSTTRSDGFTNPSATSFRSAERQAPPSGQAQTPVAAPRA